MDDPADGVLNVVGVAQGPGRPPAAQGVQVPKCDQGLRIDAVTKVQPGKITERLFGGRQRPLRRFGINAGGDADEPQFAGRGDAIGLPVMATVGEAGDLGRHLGDEVTPKQRVKASDVGARIDRRQDVFGCHSLVGPYRPWA